MKPAALAALGLTAPAQAATLVNSGGKLTFTATSGAPVNVSFSYGNTDYVGVIPQSAYHRDPIQVTGCTTNHGASFVHYTCPGVTSVTAIGGPGDDVIGSQSLAVPLTAMGGAGDDQLEGGEAADTFDGGPGGDFVFAETGDTIGGGSGTDRVRYTVPGSDRFTSEGVNLAPVGLPVLVHARRGRRRRPRQRRRERPARRRGGAPGSPSTPPTTAGSRACSRSRCPRACRARARSPWAGERFRSAPTAPTA